MKKEFLLFDLDGTLIDPVEGITKSITYALDDFGIQVEDVTTLYPFIGPPLADSFAKYYGFDGQQTQRAVEKYREYFAKQGKFESKVYQGIPEALAQLRAGGKRLLVATNKPEHFAREILKHFGLDTYFEFIGGSDLEGERHNKGLVIGYVLKEMGITQPDACLMIGDREHDVLGAAQNAMECVGALYGYGGPEELSRAGAKTLVESPHQLCTLLDW